MDSTDRHLIVTRFAVPRPEPDTQGWYRDPDWLAGRLQLFRRYFVPSVGRTGVPVILLAATEVVSWLSDRVRDLAWVQVEAQDDWHGGWTASPEITVTRLDSDDALDPEWFAVVDRAPREARVLLVKEQLRWEPASGRLHRLKRREPGPLAAFRGGRNPYGVDHRYLQSRDDVLVLQGCHLLQVVHGGNVKNRRLKAWRLDRKAPLRRLEAFGLSSDGVSDPMAFSSSDDGDRIVPH